MRKIEEENKKKYQKKITKKNIKNCANKKAGKFNKVKEKERQTQKMNKIEENGKV